MIAIQIWQTSEGNPPNCDTAIGTEAEELAAPDLAPYLALKTYPKLRAIDYASCAGLISITHIRSKHLTRMGLPRSDTLVRRFVRRPRVTQTELQIQPREAALCRLG